MRIAVLGTGFVGGTLGKKWASEGHQVTFGSRDPDSEKAQQLVKDSENQVTVKKIADVAADADVIVIATPWKSAEEIVGSLGDVQGKILIDCINPINESFTGLDLGFDTSASERIAEWAPGARVVKAFNTVSAASMADPQYGDQQATVFYCGDDADAKQVVGQLASELGMEPVDAGPLINARYLEPLAMLYIHLAVREGWGSNCAFKIMKRD